MSHAYQRPADERVEWLKSAPFIALHLAPLAVFWTGFNRFDVLLCLGLYAARMFFITGAYHRYFSHRAYKTSRVMQFLLGLGGTLAVQKGPLWWAGHHRHHHKYSDQPEDVHSPMRGLFWSHMGWIMCTKFAATPTDSIKDFARFPELRWLDKYHWLPPTLLAVGCFLAGGWSALVVGFFLSTVLTWHCTYLINSVTHLFGSRRYVTTDTSRNSFILAVLTFGEGWHNNHHYYQSTANQGFFWWELDVSYYVLRLLGLFGLVWDLRTPPSHVLEANRIRDGHADIGMFRANWAKAVAALENARRQTGEYYDERRSALDAMVENTTERANEIAEMTQRRPSTRPS
jgi:stearoyl-CoA desaturase (delta-9 desaturase)